MNAPHEINIRPEVSILSILKNINYKTWYAMAEFVDNAVQSVQSNIDDLVAIHGEGYVLHVDIAIDLSEGQEQITIRDNAAGIHTSEFGRAFRPAALPTNRTGLSEFGMGMKSAACWFANHWVVRTSAVGEPTERTVIFDVDKIVQEQIDAIPIRERNCPEERHFTAITLTKLNQKPQKKTIAKIKSHLGSMYRHFLREGLLELTLNGEPVSFEEVEVLSAAYHRTSNGTPVEWYKEFDFEVAPNKRIYGFAALREKGSTSNAGFALLRRNRVIVGSDDEGYRPKEIFGNPNSYTYQRLFGEIHLEGFEVSHTKDGIHWGEYEELALRQLKKVINDRQMPLIDQAENFRVRSRPAPITPPTPTTVSMPANPTPPMPTGSGDRPVLSTQTQVKPVTTKGAISVPVQPAKPQVHYQKLSVECRGESWNATVEITDDPAVDEWVKITELDNQSRSIRLRISTKHPFMERYVGNDPQKLEPYFLIATGICIAEIYANNSGVKNAGIFRSAINDLLLTSLLERNR